MLGIDNGFFPGSKLGSSTGNASTICPGEAHNHHGYYAYVLIFIKHKGHTDVFGKFKRIKIPRVHRDVKLVCINKKRRIYNTAA